MCTISATMRDVKSSTCHSPSNSSARSTSSTAIAPPPQPRPQFAFSTRATRTSMSWRRVSGGGAGLRFGLAADEGTSCDSSVSMFSMPESESGILSLSRQSSVSICCCCCCCRRTTGASMGMSSPPLVEWLLLWVLAPGSCGSARNLEATIRRPLSLAPPPSGSRSLDLRLLPLAGFSGRRSSWCFGSMEAPSLSSSTSRPGVVGSSMEAGGTMTLSDKGEAAAAISWAFGSTTSSGVVVVVVLDAVPPDGGGGVDAAAGEAPPRPPRRRRRRNRISSAVNSLLFIAEERWFSWVS